VRNINKKTDGMSVCKISGKMKLATTKNVVAFDMQKAKKAPHEAGKEIIQSIRRILGSCVFP
jgi:hypothetical protein